MPRLNERKTDQVIEPRVLTSFRLPQSTRDRLLAAIDHETIFTLTDAVVAASKMLPTKPKSKETNA